MAPPTSLNLRFVRQPRILPAPPLNGRTVMLDIAFAHGAAYQQVTEPFIRALGKRLALWVDHHDHMRWHLYADNPAFLLVSKLQARACPQLVDAQVVARAGHVDNVLAHADFDGCMTAVKFMRGGSPPYLEADEDARFADAPGHGFRCSAYGARLCAAFDEAATVLTEAAYLAWVYDVAKALISANFTVAQNAQLDALAEGWQSRRRVTEERLGSAKQVHPHVLLLSAPADIADAEKKLLLRLMEERSTIAVVQHGAWLTCATYRDDADALDLSAIRGLRGQRGFAWGRVDLQSTLQALGKAAEALG